MKFEGNFDSPPRKIGTVSSFEFDYSICTLVTDHSSYDQMLSTFMSAGFSDGCEYLFVDNTDANITDAYTAINRFVADAKGRHIIVCHQDIRLTSDDREGLDTRLHELETLDPNWAVAGNAGGCDGELHLHITDPHGTDRRLGQLPHRVSALDENFLVIKSSANVATSRDLTGFHQYGSDLCIQAQLRGFTSYAIDFHLTHLSGGSLDNLFELACRRISDKYSHLFLGWRVTHTCDDFRIEPPTATVLNRMVRHRGSRVLRRFPASLKRVLAPPIHALSRFIDRRVGMVED